MTDNRSVGSIQARLFRFLMISLLGLLILSGLVTWFVAYRVANEAYDHALLDPVMDIVQNVRQDPAGPSLTLSPREQEALLFDGSDRVFFQVRSPSGRWFAGGTRDLPAPPEPLANRVQLFYSARVGDAPVRICAFHQCIPMSDVNAQSVEDRIAGVVRRLLAEHSIDRAVGPDEDLRQAGLSSLDMVSLVLSIEEEFDLMVPEVSIMPSNFRSIADIGRVVVSLRKPQ